MGGAMKIKSRRRRWKCRSGVMSVLVLSPCRPVGQSVICSSHGLWIIQLDNDGFESVHVRFASSARLRWAPLRSARLGSAAAAGRSLPLVIPLLSLFRFPSALQDAALTEDGSTTAWSGATHLRMHNVVATSVVAWKQTSCMPYSVIFIHQNGRNTTKKEKKIQYVYCLSSVCLYTVNHKNVTFYFWL